MRGPLGFLYLAFFMKYPIAEHCPLCRTAATQFYKQEFFCCSECKGIFRPQQLHLGPEDERVRYQNHNNDVHDPRYRQFVSPITTAVESDFSVVHKGLDFGAGTGSAISRVLLEKGYNIRQYDPFFHHYPELLEKKYDYVVCCEVIEHFYNPRMEFSLLSRLLNPGGWLYCMTHVYSPEIPFADWYYKNDPTHVFIYQKETMEWISKFRFSELSIKGRLVKFRS